MKKLSLIGKGYHSEERPMGFYTAGDRIKAWGGSGAFWGGIYLHRLKVTDHEIARETPHR